MDDVTGVCYAELNDSQGRAPRYCHRWLPLATSTGERDIEVVGNTTASTVVEAEEGFGETI